MPQDRSDVSPAATSVQAASAANVIPDRSWDTCRRLADLSLGNGRTDDVTVVVSRYRIS